MHGATSDTCILLRNDKRFGEIAKKSEACTYVHIHTEVHARGSGYQRKVVDTWQRIDHRVDSYCPPPS